MHAKLKVLWLWVLKATILASTPLAAQQASRGQVILIARMPETLTFEVNSSAPSDFLLVGNQRSRPAAIGLTTKWVLPRGRTQIVAWAYVNRRERPALTALAVPVGPWHDNEWPSHRLLSFHLPQLSVSSSRLDSVTISDSNRAATTTISLSDSVEAVPITELLEDSYRGTMKIRIEALP